MRPATERAFEHDRRARDPHYPQMDLVGVLVSLVWGPTPASQALAQGQEILEQMRGHRGDSVIDSDNGDIGGHAMVAVGYDDTKKAFRIQNSWGRTWADSGYGWFSYDFWKRNVRFGYVID